MVLVVQRSWCIARAFASVLEEKGATVVLAKVARYDLGDLPYLATAVLDGQSRELCLRLEARGIPIVLYTVRDQSEFQFTRAPVVQKPAPVTEVVAAVEKLLLVKSLLRPSPQ